MILRRDTVAFLSIRHKAQRPAQLPQSCAGSGRRSSSAPNISEPSIFSKIFRASVAQLVPGGPQDLALQARPHDPSLTGRLYCVAQVPIFFLEDSEADQLPPPESFFREFQLLGRVRPARQA